MNIWIIDLHLKQNNSLTGKSTKYLEILVLYLPQCTCKWVDHKINLSSLIQVNTKCTKIRNDRSVAGCLIIILSTHCSQSAVIEECRQMINTPKIDCERCPKQKKGISFFGYSMLGIYSRPLWPAYGIATVKQDLSYSFLFYKPSENS